MPRLTRARRAPPVLAATLAFVALAGGHARRALAAGDAAATAQVLFEDAKRLMARGKWAEACPKLEDSQRLSPAIGTEFNLADCLEHEGRLASAWVAFIDVVDRTHARGETQRETAARMRADALVGKVGKLTVEVTTPPPDLEVLRNGQIVRQEVWGVAMPVDAGEHRIEARARGRVSWRGTVRTQNGESTSISVPELGIAAASPPSATDETPANDAPLQPAPRSDRPDRTPAIVVLGSSVVFAGVGVLGLAMHASSVNSYNADPSCPPIDASSRPAQCSDYVSSANTWNTVGVVGLVGAGAALLTGAALWVYAPARAAASTSRFTCAPGFAALDCHGVF